MNRDRNDQKSSEYNDKIVTIKRAGKTVEGSHMMRFSAPVVVGDNKGRVGVGLGKADGVPEVIRKGKEATMKNIVTVAVDGNKSIPHDFTGEYGNTVVLMKRAPEGTGTIAGDPARAVMELAGIQNIRTRSFGSSNKTNIVLAALKGFRAVRSPEEIAKKRNKSVEDILDWKGGQEHSETA